jgi:hypothetical protein
MKIILISLVIFFAICSRSWAGEIDGKGLECSKAGVYWVYADEYDIWLLLYNIWCFVEYG